MKLKRILTIFSILCVIIFFVDSQEKILKFFGNNGILATYPIAEIDSIKVGTTEANEKSLKIHRGNEFSELSVANIDSIKIEEEIDPSQIPDNEIWYRTADNQIYDIYQCTKTYGHQPFDASIVSHTYENGIGVIKFDAPVTKINDHTFGNGWAASMTELYLPNCIEYIGTGAICNTGLSTLRIPNNLKCVDSYGLNNPNLESFTGSHVTEDGRCVVVEDGFMPDFGNTQTPVKNYMAAFAPAGITEYTLPNNVEILGWYTFAWCPELRKITFNEGLKRILGDCFVGTNLDCEIILPSTLEDIGVYAFHSCSGIKGFYGNENFHTSDNICLISKGVPGKRYTVLHSFAGVGLKDYIIPDGIEMIQNYAFENESLQTITFPESIKSIGSAAFYKCYNLEAAYGKCIAPDNISLVIEEGVLETVLIRKNLKEYVVPDGIKVAKDIISYDNNIEKIVVSDNVEVIGNKGFESFSFNANLHTVVLSANLKKIDSWSLTQGCNNLRELYVRSPIPPKILTGYMMDSYIIPYPPKDLKIYVPKETFNIYKTYPIWDSVAKYMQPYDYGDLSEFYPDYYFSTDYSTDGMVTTLQTASVGEGIDIVLMGDAYSDRQIADGTYAKDMEYIYDNLFTEEPYKSFKDYFNVHYVNVVSATEGYEHSGATLGGYFGGGTLVGGNDNTVFTYAQKAISANDMDEALIIVAMNSDNYAGTCYMYYPTYATGTFGSGPSVAYFPRGGDETTFAQLLHHEACGHGFAKLADEYAYEDMGIVPNDYESQIKEQQSGWGWWKNVDFTNDPSSIRWSHFINDTRYANEGLGAFEGGLTYWNGVWRPTENSIMRYNTGGFNAPSREAIYYRIHKLAYGDDWQYDYEKFAEWDAKNRTAAATAARMKAKKPANYKPTHPPVIVNKSWKEAK